MMKARGLGAILSFHNITNLHFCGCTTPDYNLYAGKPLHVDKMGKLETREHRDISIPIKT